MIQILYLNLNLLDSILLIQYQCVQISDVRQILLDAYLHELSLVPYCTDLIYCNIYPLFHKSFCLGLSLKSSFLYFHNLFLAAFTFDLITGYPRSSIDFSIFSIVIDSELKFARTRLELNKISTLSFSTPSK